MATTNKAIARLTTSYQKLVVLVGKAIQSWVFDLGAAVKPLTGSEVRVFKADLLAAINISDRDWSRYSAAGVALQYLVDTKVITENQARNNYVGSIDALTKIKSALDPVDTYGGRSAAIQTLKAAKKATGINEWLTSEIAKQVQAESAALRPTNQGNKNGKGKGKGKGNTKNGGNRNRSPKVSKEAVLKVWLEAGDNLRKVLADDPQFAVDKTDVVQNDLANIDQLLMNGAERIAQAEAEAATA